MTGDYKKQKGVAVLYAVMIAGVVLLVSYSMSQLALRETNLSLIGKRSQEAFYAANSAAECATYGDVRQAVFPSHFLPTGSGLSFVCLGSTVFFDFEQTGETYVTTFELENIGEGDACATLNVTKAFDGSNLDTTIRADGFDQCGGNNRVQRSIEVHY